MAEPGILTEHISAELQASAAAANVSASFAHLERAHVLGQSSIYYHTLVHLRMLRLAFRMKSLREIWGQLFRIAGAATKTPLGIYPHGNTGGSNVWFFKPMPVPDDLKQILESSK